MRITRFALAAAAVVATVACSSSAVPEVLGFTASPLVSTPTNGRLYDIDVRTSPQPPYVGMMQAQLVITDHVTHQPVDGLTVGVVPWMPAMGHGTSLLPTVRANGHGTYTIDQLAFIMAGEWELKLTLDGAGHDTAVPAFYVP